MEGDPGIECPYFASTMWFYSILDTVGSGFTNRPRRGSSGVCWFSRISNRGVGVRNADLGPHIYHIYKSTREYLWRT
jgi:hypothetical protein